MQGKQSAPHCHILAPAGRDSISKSTKARYAFVTPHSSDPASTEGNTVANHRRDLRAYQFGINTDLREVGCRSIAECGFGPGGGESCRMMHPALGSRAFWRL